MIAPSVAIKRKVFTSRLGTPLYYLKTTAEGVDLSVMIRFTGHTGATIARWLHRMGDHSQSWHNQLFRELTFMVLQLDELYTRVRGMAYGKRSDLFDKLHKIGLRRLIQTAFIERVNLTFRQSVSSLSRRTWAYAQSEHHLLMHCEWFRAYYHFVRPHESLRVPLSGLAYRYRSRTPAMALGLTDRIWSVRDLLHYPVPQDR